jgi:putative membrane protein
VFHLFLHWLIVAAAIVIAARVVPGVRVESWPAAFFGAAVLGLLNVVVRPVLAFLTLPLTFLTLGLFLLVVNAIVFSLAAYLSPKFQVRGFWAALFASIVVSLVSAAGDWLIA